VLVVGTALFLLVRIVRALLIGDAIEVPEGAIGVAIAAALGVAGLVLSLSRRRRWLGAGLLSPAAVLLGLLAGEIMFRVSATGGLIVSRLSSDSGGLDPWWVLSMTIGVGAALGFIGAAVWWWPGGRPLIDDDDAATSMQEATA